MNDYTFGEYLYQKRKQSGDSQNELVEKLGVTGKAVSKWENGSAKPRACLKNGCFMRNLRRGAV